MSVGSYIVFIVSKLFLQLACVVRKYLNYPDRCEDFGGERSIFGPVTYDLTSQKQRKSSKTQIQ